MQGNSLYIKKLAISKLLYPHSAKEPFGRGSVRGFKGEPVGEHTESSPGLPLGTEIQL